MYQFKVKHEIDGVTLIEALQWLKKGKYFESESEGRCTPVETSQQNKLIFEFPFSKGKLGDTRHEFEYLEVENKIIIKSQISQYRSLGLAYGLMSPLALLTLDGEKALHLLFPLLSFY